MLRAIEPLHCEARAHAPRHNKARADRFQDTGLLNADARYVAFSAETELNADRAVLAQVDTNKDGKLTREEYMSG
jgi:hypothetical protein